MTMTPEEKEEKRRKIVEKHNKVLMTEQLKQYIGFRSEMIYGLDCCDLMNKVCDLIKYMPDEGSEKLRNLLTQTRDALYDELLRVADKTFDEYEELLKARDELKEMKKKKKKKVKK